MTETQLQGRPLLYARLALDDDKVHSLPGLIDGCVNGYRPAFTLIRVEFGKISWRDDGEDPAQDDGMPSTKERYFGDPANFKFVRSTGGLLVVHVLYYAAPADEAA